MAIFLQQRYDISLAIRLFFFTGYFIFDIPFIYAFEFNFFCLILAGSINSPGLPANLQLQHIGPLRGPFLGGVPYRIGRMVHDLCEVPMLQFIEVKTVMVATEDAESLYQGIGSDGSRLHGDTEVLFVIIGALLRWQLHQREILRLPIG